MDKDPFKEQLRSVIEAALAEDIGSGDITSELLIPEDVQAQMSFIAREGMVVCGTSVPGEVYKQLSSEVEVDEISDDGTLVPAGTVLVKVAGPARKILTGERVCLNIMQRMCGIATITHVYAEAVKGTKATILDTRKTMPGMRQLDKYAVRTGGGRNHRMGLDDMVLIKDNHVEIGLRTGGLSIGELVAKARHEVAQNIPIIVECDTLEQVAEVIAAKPDRILLDNMNTRKLKEAVKLVAGRVPLESSGGVTLEMVREIAETGVDFISVGKLTHSAPAADIGADITYYS